MDSRLNPSWDMEGFFLYEMSIYSLFVSCCIGLTALTLTEKHFNQTKSQIFDGYLDLDENIFELSIARRKFRLNPNGILTLGSIIKRGD